MNKIFLGIYDEHRLAQEGISNLLANHDTLEVIFKASGRDELMAALKSKYLHILIINVHVANTQFLNLLMQININFPKINTLIISHTDDEELVLKIIKSGAKGFLSKDSGYNELVEALYMLRNGHDYYSEPITHLLLKKYISRLKNESAEGSSKVSMLSTREIEIIQLWGNSLTNKEIAEKLFISVRTVESHKNHIMQKLNLKSAVDLVKFAIRNNLIEIQ